MRYLFFILLLLVCDIVLLGQQQRSIITGKIINDETGKPVADASVFLASENIPRFTNEAGEFSLEGNAGEDSLIIYRVGFTMKTILINKNTLSPLIVRLTPNNASLDEVIVSTGYQKIAKERATGSFVSVNKELLNRRVSANILDRLEGVASGLAFNSNDEYGSKEISVRGRSTLYANSDPLIVVDNFPYEGSLDNINPNDVLTITVLRDAAAASIWGVRAGNGVIVITTKKGSLSKKISVELNVNAGWTNKPDLFYVPRMTSAELIGVEKKLFDRGYYDDKIADVFGQHLPLSPAVELFALEREGGISSEDAARQLSVLENSDKRKDYDRFIYHYPLRQQYAVNISGGSERATYYLSAGFDHSLGSLREEQKRYTINSQNTFELFKGFTISAGLNYIRGDAAAGKYSIGGSIYPYERVADDKGNGLPQTDLFRKNYTQQLISKGYLDWENNPVKDALLNNGSARTEEIRLAMTANYRINSLFSASINYQYQQQDIDMVDLHDANSYFTRDLVNRFSQFDFVTGNVLSRPIPVGGILEQNNNKVRSINIRGQLNYHQSIGEHEITAIIGGEEREVYSNASGFRVYGYDDITLASTPVDYTSSFLIFPQYYYSRILGSPEEQSDLTDRYRSTFANAAYTFRGKYTISASARKDASNYFGVSTNQRAVPLWSAGLKWDIHKESFYSIDFLPLLSLRMTYGFNGNLNKNLAAYTTIRFNGNNSVNLPSANIVNPPNEKLRWEKTRMINIAVDFQSRQQRVTGSIDWYVKKGTDLTGSAAIDGTTGILDGNFAGNFSGNVANMKGSGVDIQLTTHNLTGKFKWQTDVLMSRATDKVTKYNFTPTTSGLLSGTAVYPLEGRPVYGIYSFAWAGLDPLTGDPQGYLDKTISKDYNQLINEKPTDLTYHGTARPLWFGSVRNTFSYKGFDLSANIIYKLDYYFRRRSIIYSSLVNNYDTHTDYSLRWQQPGDELLTSVPSMPDVIDGSRDYFYQSASPLVQRGDHFRLQDIRLSYSPSASFASKLFLQDMQLYVYANNLGLIWKQNDAGIDPDFQRVPPAPFNISIGVTARFK